MSSSINPYPSKDFDPKEGRQHAWDQVLDFRYFFFLILEHLHILNEISWMGTKSKHKIRLWFMYTFYT